MWVSVSGYIRCGMVRIRTATHSRVCFDGVQGSLSQGSSIIALTPIAAFRPRRWRGALLKADTEVRFRVLDPCERPVSATGDLHEVRDVLEVTLRKSTDRTVTLLFDPEHNLEERILSEQFVV